MKRKLLIIFLSVVSICCLAFGISACGSEDSSTDEPEHIHTYNTDNVCTECGYELEYTEGLAYLLYEGEYVFLGGGTNEETDVTIAAYYNGLPVTSVALYGEEDFETHVIGLIMSGAFTEHDYDVARQEYYSDKITSITIPEGVTCVKIIGYDNLESASLPESVSSLEIEYCDNLIDINIPSKALYVYIYDCPLLETETVDGLTYYKNCLLCWDENLTKAEIREGTTIISRRILGTQSNLIEVTLPESMTVISEYAFADCTTLKSVTLSDKITYIGYYAFYNCSSLTSIIIPNSVITIGDCAFYSCTSLVNITMGSNVTEIGEYSFIFCYKLAEVCNLSSLEIISGSADNGLVAYYAKNVYTATSGESHLTTQDDYLFIYDGDNNYYLIAYNGTETDITLPDSVNGNAYSINLCAFYGCTSVTSVIIPDCITEISRGAFMNFTSLKSITIPDSVTSIGDSAFYDCTSLECITIPNSVTSIGNYSFFGCTTLESVTIGNSVISIGESAFRGCTSLESVTIGSSVTSIDDSAFSDCMSLESIVIPDSVTFIGDGAFANCNSLAEVYITDLVAWCNLNFIEESGIPLSATAGTNLYLYNPTEQAYELVINLVIPDNVTSIGDYAFYKCTSLTSVTIPDSVTSIGRSAFYWCTSLASVNIGDSVTSIGDYVFEGCTSLTSVTIGSGLTSIGYDAFSWCESLENVYYTGTTEEWSNISIGTGNTYLTNATIYYYSETQPTEAGNYWYYDENDNIVVWTIE